MPPPPEEVCPPDVIEAAEEEQSELVTTLLDADAEAGNYENQAASIAAQYEQAYALGDADAVWTHRQQLASLNQAYQSTRNRAISAREDLEEHRETFFETCEIELPEVSVDGYGMRRSVPNLIARAQYPSSLEAIAMLRMQGIWVDSLDEALERLE